MIGDEGMVAVQALLGSSHMTNDCFMQVAGAGFRVPLEEMRVCFDEDQQVRSQVLAFLRSHLVISAQLSACNKLHEAEARLARWLLMASDRAHTEDLQLTQEFLAEMLGARRTTVALVAGAIQRSGYISYNCGRVQIVDREDLTQVACECYNLTKLGRRLTS